MSDAAIRTALVDSFHAGLAACEPYGLTLEHLPAERPALVIAAGKAAWPMLRAAEERYPGIDGVAVTRYGHGGETRSIALREAGHPHPDVEGAAAAEEALARAAAL